MFTTDDTRERSPYWLSPGIDVPTREEILPGMRCAKGLFPIFDEHAEDAFVRTDTFMRNSPTWRLDVLGDILIDLQSSQQHAAVELFRELSRRNPEVGIERPLRGFRHACQALGLVLPGNLDGGDRQPRAPSKTIRASSITATSIGSLAPTISVVPDTKRAPGAGSLTSPVSSEQGTSRATWWSRPSIASGRSGARHAPLCVCARPSRAA